MVRATFAGITTALSALQANQKRLDITGHNLSNMNTTGYTRQALDTSSINYTNSVSRYNNDSDIAVGFGVSMDRVTQVRDPYLDVQYRNQMERSGYTDAMQISLDSLAKVLDESNISGIRTAFDDIQTTLLNIHDPAKTPDNVFESELRVRIGQLTNLFNEASRQIEEARGLEYQRLDGVGTNENGAEQIVNDILEQIGKLNKQIKHNQIFNHPDLELLDKRNVLLDELSSYVPIEVTYFKDAQHTGDKDWPDDLKVDLVYYKEDAGKTTKELLTLVNGTEGVGSLDITGDKDNSYLNTTAAFTGADGTTTVTISGSDESKNSKNELGGGSIQASLDMLSGQKITDADKIDTADVRGYQYYQNHLDKLANDFSTIFNELNKMGNKGAEALLLVNRDSKDGTGITAANIGVNVEWANGNVALGKGIAAEGNNASDTARLMLKAMSFSYDGKTTGDAPYNSINLKGKTFAGYINNVSTILATDSATNQNNLKTNVTVLNGIQDSRDAVSGISLDEEAANMMTYMAAYNAASRLMTALDEALNTLINNTGRVGL